MPPPQTLTRSGEIGASRAPADIAERDVSATPPCPLPGEQRAVFRRVRDGAMVKRLQRYLAFRGFRCRSCGPPLRRAIRISRKSPQENILI